jgi:subtilisin family serine protease
MKRTIWILAALIAIIFFQAPPAAADQRLIVRTTSLPLLQNACVLNLCKVVESLDGTINQLFLVTVPDLLPIQLVEQGLQLVPGVLDVEADLLQRFGRGVPLLHGIPTGLFQQQPVSYYGSNVWMGYAQQPASGIIRLGQARTQFQKTGHAIVADIDTGVDFSHPALQGVLLQGYDFTRNRPGGDEMADVSGVAPNNCVTGCSSGDVNQSTAAVLDQSTAAVLDQSTAAVLDQSTAAVLDSPQYAAFGHGTMVAGVIHLVAPTAMLMPLKAFHSDGTGYTSDILRGIYYAVQNHAQVINMSFDFTSYSGEVARAIAYAQNHEVTCVASAGNEGSSHIVYPAGLSRVMGVASTNDFDQPSSFSNFGPQDVWVAAPGEDIISTYPFKTYASESGTSFSAPLVSGTVALLLDVNPKAAPFDLELAIGHAKPLSPSMGHGRLDVYAALMYIGSITTGW